MNQRRMSQGKAEFYGQLPILGRRLFTRGVPAAVLFLVFWYLLKGDVIWGYFMNMCMKLTAFYFPVTFEPEAGKFVHSFSHSGKTVACVFDTNLLHTGLVQAITVLAMWPHRNRAALFRLAGWCLLFSVLYQTFDVVIQLYAQKIGPKMADTLQIFYEETTYNRIIAKIASFDKFILRYWAGFPVFMFALVADYFFAKNKARSQGGKRK